MTTALDENSFFYDCALVAFPKSAAVEDLGTILCLTYGPPLTMFGDRSDFRR